MEREVASKTRTGRDDQSQVHTVHRSRVDVEGCMIGYLEARSGVLDTLGDSKLISRLVNTNSSNSEFQFRPDHPAECRTEQTGGGRAKRNRDEQSGHHRRGRQEPRRPFRRTRCGTRNTGSANSRRWLPIATRRTLAPRVDAWRRVFMRSASRRIDDLRAHQSVLIHHALHSACQSSGSAKANHGWHEERLVMQTGDQDPSNPYRPVGVGVVKSRSRARPG